MGLFGLFGDSFKKHAGRVANRRAQNPDRWESIQALSGMKTAAAVEALLRRFTVRVDPSIIDQEEKDAVFHGIVGAGDDAIDPTRRFLASAKVISWPLKILEQLLDEDAVVAELLGLLEGMDTDYERDPERKIQVLSYLEDRADGRIATAAQRFLTDMNETVRFHAAGAVFAQEDAGVAREALVSALIEEESVRVRARILDGIIARGWDVAASSLDEVRKQLPDGYAVDGKGALRKAAGR